MRILQVVPSFWPAVRYGGPIVSVRQMSKAVAERGMEVDVATTNADGPLDLDVPLDRWVDDGPLRVRYFRRTPRVDYGFSPSLAAFLLDQVRSYDLVHVTSTFSFPSTLAGIAARRRKVPYLVSPRGSLQQWSLSQKRWKKGPYWTLFERAHLEAATAIHATAEMEREEVLKVLPRARVVIVPNGVEAIEEPGGPRDPKKIVFLGRLHKKKGFDVLVPALSLLERMYPGVVTVVAGPDDTGEWPRVEQLLGKVHPRPDVRYLGAINGPARFALLASASVFVLTSHSENFGQAVVEAMMCGTPVVVSTNCPWRSIQERGAGYWVPNNPVEVSEALQKVLVANDGGVAMQSAARSLAAEFQWSAVGSKMQNLYLELCSNPFGAGLRFRGV